jgi:hypothetical protein
LINIVHETQKRRLRSTNIQSFKANYRKHPLHLCRVWRDLQTTAINEAKISQAEAKKDNTYKGFMIANHFFKTYGSDNVRAAAFSGIERFLTHSLGFMSKRLLL